MEKLELKHLAPYLPYGLKWMKGNNKYNTAHLSTKRIGIISQKGFGDIEKHSFEYLPKNLKPILRPLSDLTKEIEVNGEKFVPIECLDYGCVEYDYIFKSSNDYVNISILNEQLEQIDIIQSDNIALTSHGTVNKLISWHFDVFGLIKSGLAIDINTLL